MLRWDGDDARHAGQGSLTISNDPVEFEQGLADPALVFVSGWASGGRQYRGVGNDQILAGPCRMSFGVLAIERSEPELIELGRRSLSNGNRAREVNCP